MFFSELGPLRFDHFCKSTTKNNLQSKEVNQNKIVNQNQRHTFPVVVFFTSNATSVVPSGAFFTSQALVSSPSPGTTGAVKRTPKYRSEEGTPSPTALRIARAANPNVDRPCRITPPNPASEPTRGSVRLH